MTTNTSTSKAKKKETIKSSDENKPNLYGMIQNVLIASINKGQIIPAIVGIVVIVIAIKLSEEDASALAFLLVDKFTSTSTAGWGVSVFTIGLWSYRAKRIRQSHASEMSRISEEKKQLQELLLNKKLDTSN